MTDRARLTFTASLDKAPVTEELLENALNDPSLSAVRDFAKVTFVEKGSIFPSGQRWVFGIQIQNEAFGSSPIDGANRAALAMIYAVRARGVDVTPSAIIHQTNNGFHRNTGLETDFNDPAKRFGTGETHVREGRLRPDAWALRHTKPTAAMS
jgi:hypothetical protein